MAAGSVSQHQIHALYRDHHGWLEGWLRRKLGCPDNAADMAHDTFLRVLAARERSFERELREPRAYLTTVAKGVLVNWCRRQALERSYLDALARLPEPEAPSPEQRLVILETLHEIDALLDALPPLVRSVFLLAQIEGMKYEDIAQRIGVSLITVKRYMKQAFRRCLTLVA